MKADKESCVFPGWKATESEDYIVITQKVVDRINDASVERDDRIIAADPEDVSLELHEQKQH